MGEVRPRGGSRNRMLGRCAGLLFLAGAIASLPANLLLSDPDPGWWMHLINVLALVSGLICLRIPWDRIDARWLHLIPPVAAAEIVLTVSALGVHGEIYLWYFVLGAVFNGYAFRNRWHVAAHTAVAGLGFGWTALFSLSWDQDALVRVIVAVPTLAVAAGVIVWLREGLETREANLRVLYDEREAEARTDSLTGLRNRRALMMDLTAAVQPGAEPSTLALFDLDGFKQFNDRFGHPAGDALLERLARNLEVAVGPGGRAYRLGGDEFCVLLDASDAEADELIRECAAALAERSEDSDIGASHGSAALPAEADSASAALSTADRRMYRVKDRRQRLVQSRVEQIAAPVGTDRRTGSRGAPGFVAEIREPATAPSLPPRPVS